MNQLLLLISVSWIMAAEGQTARRYKINLKPYPSRTIVPQLFSGEYSNGVLTWNLEYKSYIHHEPPLTDPYSKSVTSWDQNTSYTVTGYRYVKFDFLFYDSLKRVIGDTVRSIFKIELREGKGVGDLNGIQKITWVAPAEPYSGMFKWSYTDIVTKQQKKEEDSIWKPLGSAELKLRRQKENQPVTGWHD